jgi:hypothetical protein
MYWQGFWFRVPRLVCQLAGLFLWSASDGPEEFEHPTVRLRRNAETKKHSDEELTVATISGDAQQRSAAAAVKAERALDKVAAMREYEAEELALRANTARLRALRLAREAENTIDANAGKPSKKEATQDAKAQVPAKKKAVKRVSAPKGTNGKLPKLS